MFSAWAAKFGFNGTVILTYFLLLYLDHTMEMKHVTLTLLLIVICKTFYYYICLVIIIEYAFTQRLKIYVLVLFIVYNVF